MTTPHPRRSPQFALLAAGAATVLLASGCGGGLLAGKNSPNDKGPIVFGMIAPFSGGQAASGPYMQNGAQLAINEINAGGGIDGRKLELKVADDACDAKTAVAAANKLITQKVVISVGGYCSSSALPTLPIFAKASVPMIIPGANSSEISDQGLKNVFMINATNTQQSEAAVEFIKKDGASKVALVDDNTSYSVELTKLTTELLKKDGLKVSAHDSVTAGESDYSANVNTVLKSQPDFVYWTGYYQEGGLIIRQLRQAGYDGPVMVADGSVDEQLIKIAGEKNATNVFATMTQTPDTIKGAEAWIADYKKAFGTGPGPYSTQSYDAVRVAAEGIKKAGSTNSVDVIKALEGIDGFKLFSGPLKFTDKHTLSKGGFQILEVKGGKFVLKDSLQ